MAEFISSYDCGVLINDHRVINLQRKKIHNNTVSVPVGVHHRAGHCHSRSSGTDSSDVENSGVDDSNNEEIEMQPLISGDEN